MGCCWSDDGYARLVEDISLTDNILPHLPEASKLKDCTEADERALRKLFSKFDQDGDNLINYDELHAGLCLLGKSPSKKSLTRIVKTAHLSSAPSGTIEFKGFALALLSRRSLLYDYMYEGFDTVEELAKEIEDEKKKGNKWNIFSSK